MLNKPLRSFRYLRNVFYRVRYNSKYFRNFCTKNVESNTANALENNPYFKKYSKKITAFKSSTPREFQSRLHKLNENVTPVTVKHAQTKPVSNAGNQATPTRPKKLDDIVRVDLIETLSAEEISDIWKQKFTSKDGICAVIPSSVYDKIYSRSWEYSMFLYPLIRSSGYEFMVGQFSGHNCYFTSLANYQVHKEDSPVCLTIMHFPELQETKQIVLMCGEYDNNVMNGSEAQFLANQVQIYYSTTSLKKKLLLWTFNKEPQNFKHEDLISELEKL